MLLTYLCSKSINSKYMVLNKYNYIMSSWVSLLTIKYFYFLDNVSVLFCK